MLNFKIKKIQFALFPKNFNPLDKSRIAQDIKVRTDNIFDGEDMILPLPMDAPLEIPRIILKSKNGYFSCNISLNRIDFFRNISGNDDLSHIKDELLKIIKQINSYFIDDNKILIGRIGFVIDFAIEIEKEKSIELLRKNLLKENSYYNNSKKIKSILLVFTEMDTLDGFSINKQYQYGNEIDNSLVFRFDINTPSEKIDEYNLKTEEIMRIIDGAINEISNNKLNDLLSQNNE